MSTAKEGRGLISSPFPWCEGALLPGTVLIAVTALLFAIFRVITLAWGIPFGILAHTAVAIAVGIGAYATCIAVYYGLPFYMRAIDFLVVVSLVNILSYVENTAVIKIMLPISVVAWLLAYYGAVVIPRLLPMRLRSQVYAVQDAGIASEMALRRVLDMFAVFIAFIVLAGVAPSINQMLAGDFLFALWAGIFVVGVLTYYALVKQISLRRVVETNKEVLALGSYSKAWLLGIAVPALLALLVAFIFPANISPLIKIDLSQIFRNVVMWFLSLVFGIQGRNAHYSFDRDFVGGGSHGGDGAFVAPSGGSTAVGSMDPMGLLASLGLLALLVAAIYIGSKKMIEASAENASESQKGFWATFKGIILWPWRVLVRWWHRCHVQVQEWQGVQHVAEANATLMKRIRQRLQYPEDPVAYIRFIYGRLLKKATQAGYTRPKSVTASEYAHILARLNPESEQPVEELTNMYCHARYGQRPPEEFERVQVLNLLRRASRFIRTLRS
jgi:hypothetical protein